MIFKSFAAYDNLDLRSIILFGGLLTVASYAAVLALVRQLTAWTALTVGVVWFSLADSQNALWSFQLSWYLVVFFFAAMLLALLAPKHHRNLFALAGIGAAVAASYSSIQGFAVWPVGLICLVLIGASWRWLVGWLGAAVATTLLYLHGFNTSISVACPPGSSTCGLAYGVTHPIALGRFMVLLLGSVYDGRVDLLTAEIIGAVILVLAAFVVVRSIREGGQQLPILLIAFGLGFDLIIALGRLGYGAADALGQSRYSMPNLIILAGVAAYLGTHLPDRRGLKLAGVGACGTLLAILCVNTTQAGLVAGRATDQIETVEARILVNLHRMTRDEAVLDCDFAWAVYPSLSPNALHAMPILIHDMAEDHLSLFKPGSLLTRYRADGAPSQLLIYQTGVTLGVVPRWPQCVKP